MNRTLTLALAAAREKNAEDPIALDLRSLSSFTDSFLICHGRNARHVQAIAGRFGGGGHKKAAGATIQLGLPDAERALEEAIQQALAAQDAAGSPPAAT